MRYLKKYVMFFLIAGMLLSGCQKKEQTVAAAAVETVWTITQFNALYDELQTFYTIVNTNGELIIIDGGTAGNEEIVRRVINGYGGRVKAWILTKPAAEHMGAFVSICSDPQEIVIDKVYDAFIDRQRFGGYASRSDCEIYDEYLSLSKDDEKFVHVNRDAEFFCCGLKFECFNAYDSYVEEYSDDISEDGSLMLKISGKKETFLLCSDVTSDMEKYILEEYADRLDCDIVQMSCHGNNGLSVDFYRTVSPKTAFFDGKAGLYQTDGVREEVSYEAYKAAFEADGVVMYDLTTAPNSVELK